jgi:hypothetical protein
MRRSTFTQFHTYRIVLTPGEDVKVYVDGDATPVLASNYSHLEALSSMGAFAFIADRAVTYWDEVVTKTCDEPPANAAPICTGASASPSLLDDTDDALHSVSVTGVTDADADPISIRIESITSDEPVSTGGPYDCAGLQANEAHLRARETSTNGRVYAVHFSASDDNGGRCEGTVNVCVPDTGTSCTDDGQTHVSVLRNSHSAFRHITGRPR